MNLEAHIIDFLNNLKSEQEKEEYKRQQIQIELYEEEQNRAMENLQEEEEEETIIHIPLR